MAKILIVDDAAFMRMMLKDILTKGGHEVIGEAEKAHIHLLLKQEVCAFFVSAFSYISMVSCP